MSENVYLSFNFDDMSIEYVAISAVLSMKLKCLG